MIVNEEGHLKGLPDNKHISGIVGDAFFIGASEEDFVSLTPGQIKSLSACLKVDDLKKEWKRCVQYAKNSAYG